MLNFCANGGFGALVTLDLTFGSGGIVLALTGTSVDDVLDALAAGVLLLGFGTLGCAQIAAVAVDLVLFAGQKVGGNGDVMFVGRCGFQRMNCM